MNLFYLSRSARESAQSHGNRHVVKMVLETAQLLCTTHRILGGELPAERERLLYRTTHAYHPVAVWVRSSCAHYAFAYELFVELLAEYTFRYGKLHACSKLVGALAEPPAALRDSGFRDPPACMPDEFRVSDDVVTCYREYYRRGKAHLLQYKARAPPRWL